METKQNLKPPFFTHDDKAFQIRFMDIYPTLMDEIPLRGARDPELLRLHGEIVNAIDNLRQYLELNNDL